MAVTMDVVGISLAQTDVDDSPIPIAQTLEQKLDILEKSEANPLGRGCIGISEDGFLGPYEVNSLEFSRASDEDIIRNIGRAFAAEITINRGFINFDARDIKSERDRFLDPQDLRYGVTLAQNGQNRVIVHNNPIIADSTGHLLEQDPLTQKFIRSLKENNLDTTKAREFIGATQHYPFLLAKQQVNGIKEYFARTNLGTSSPLPPNSTPADKRTYEKLQKYLDGANSISNTTLKVRHILKTHRAHYAYLLKETKGLHTAQ